MRSFQYGTHWPAIHSRADVTTAPHTRPSLDTERASTSSPSTTTRRVLLTRHRKWTHERPSPYPARGLAPANAGDAIRTQGGRDGGWGMTPERALEGTGG